MEREPNTQYVLSLSYGKDSIACLAVIDELGLPLDRIVHAEVWATQDIPADLPPMIEFKNHADEIIKRRWGIEVEHICAMQKPTDISQVSSMKKLTYEDIFYRPVKSSKSETLLSQRVHQVAVESVRIQDATMELVHRNQATGYPTTWSLWCNGELKKPCLTDSRLRQVLFRKAPRTRG